MATLILYTATSYFSEQSRSTEMADVSHLYNKASFYVLLIISLFVTSRAYLGSPILCLATEDILSQTLINDFCYANGPFSIVDAWNGTLEDDVIYPGVTRYDPTKKIVKHSYYQYVGFVLMLQAFLIRIPEYFWRVWDSKRLQRFVKALLELSVGEQSEFEEKMDALKEYLEHRWGKNGYLAFNSFNQRLLELITVGFQFEFTNFFLQRKFYRLGIEAFRYALSGSTELSYSEKLFPRLGMCTFSYYTGAGRLRQVALVCAMSSNFFYEKIYIFLWFWFVLLAIITCLSILFKCLLFLYWPLRYWVLLGRTNVLDQRQIKRLVKEAPYSDWLIFHKLAVHANPSQFMECLDTYPLKEQ